MSVPTAVAVLNGHGVRWRAVGAWLNVMETFTHNGETYDAWVECPRTMPALLRWLGY